MVFTEQDLNPPPRPSQSEDGARRPQLKVVK
jgi:hypothetical protein